MPGMLYNTDRNVMGWIRDLIYDQSIRALQQLTMRYIERLNHVPYLLGKCNVGEKHVPFFCQDLSLPRESHLRGIRQGALVYLRGARRQGECRQDKEAIMLCSE